MKNNAKVKAQKLELNIKSNTYIISHLTLNLGSKYFSLLKFLLKYSPSLLDLQ